MDAQKAIIVLMAASHVMTVREIQDFGCSESLVSIADLIHVTLALAKFSYSILHSSASL